MVVILVVDYAEFKTLAPLFVGTGADAQYLVRDGTSINTGFEVLAVETTKQLGLRYGAMQKPPTFDTDFPKRKYVTSITVV